MMNDLSLEERIRNLEEKYSQEERREQIAALTNFALEAEELDLIKCDEQFSKLQEKAEQMDNERESYCLETFFELAVEALFIRRSIDLILACDEAAYAPFLHNNKAWFDEFHSLRDHLCKNIEAIHLETLANNTPEKNKTKVYNNLRLAFDERTNIGMLLNEAFTKMSWARSNHHLFANSRPEEEDRFSSHPQEDIGPQL